PNDINLLERLKPPSGVHLFGTDDLGRDLFSRVLAGARISLEVAAIILSISVAVGTLLGIVAGLVGGLVDELIMRATDLFLAFPALILAAAIAATLGPSLSHTVIALSTVYWPWYTRLARGQVLSLRERDFVVAARVVGAGTPRIVVRELLPNVMPIVVVQMSLDVGYAILFTSSLSFLGLGAQPPTPEWGAMMTQTRLFLWPELYLAALGPISSKPGPGYTVARIAESVPGPLTERLGALAAELGVWLVPGSFYERGADGSIYNTAVAISPEG